MKKTLLTIGLALVASVTAHASLHDTYEQSCSRYGSKGYIYNDLIMWDWGNQIVVESFIDNECVMVRYCPSKGFDHTYATCWADLQANCGGSQTWTSYSDGRNRQCWTTDDNLIYAFWSMDGRLQIAYAWWLHKHDLFDYTPVAPHAPVEDGLPNSKSQSKDSGIKM